VRIDIVYDSDVSLAPAGFKACINAVVQYYDTLFTNNVTAVIDVGYGSIEGRPLSSSELGSSLSNLSYANYTQVAAALVGQGAPGSGSLPATAPTSSLSLVMSTAEAKALGLGSGSVSGIDGYAGFSSGANWSFNPTQTGSIGAGSFDFTGTVEHEFSEILGRFSSLNQGSEYSVTDLFRFSAPGVRQLTSGAPSYFSVDDGASALGYFNNYVTGNSGDLGDWALHGPVDSYNDDGTVGVLSPVSSTDKTLMAAIGWTLAPNAASLSVASSIPQLGAAAAAAALAAGQDVFVTVVDSGANIGANIDKLEPYVLGQNLAAIQATSAVNLTVSQLLNDPYAVGDLQQSGATLAVIDSASTIGTYLGTLASDLSQGLVGSITVSGSSFSTLTVKSITYSTYISALAGTGGNFDVVVDTSDNQFAAFSGLPTHGTIAAVSGPIASYTLSANANGHTVDIDYSGGGYAFTDVNAIQFTDRTIIVAQTPASNGTVTTGNVTELYAAVFGREPDVPGLNYYQNQLKAIPAIPLLTFAEWFLQSPEYTGNSAHSYAQGTAGDTQFIDDSYGNLLHRAPETGAVPYYLAMIGQFTQGLTPGTASYAAAELAAHAAVLTGFSQSAEFLGDVQITAQHPADSQHWLFLT
jgi:uncharacterized protein GlcG (DUF336 family)